MEKIFKVIEEKLKALEEEIYFLKLERDNLVRERKAREAYIAELEGKVTNNA